MTRLHSTALISPSRAESNKPLKKAVAEKAVTAFLLPVHKERLEENLASLRSGRQNFLSEDFEGKVECFFIKDKDSKALQMRSMQHVSRSGEEGGMTTRSCRHWL